MVFKFVDLLIILVICGQFLTDTNAKHRSHRFRCPVLKHCTKHKHKICGSDGINNILFDSHCHLRKASCEQGIQLKTVHRNKCDLANGAFDYEQHGSNGLIVDDQTKQQHQIENENDQNRNLFNIENIDQLNNLNKTNIQINLQQDNAQQDNGQQDNGQSKNIIEECKTEQYELMKYQLFQKGNYSSLFYHDKIL